MQHLLEDIRGLFAFLNLTRDASGLFNVMTMDSTQPGPAYKQKQGLVMEEPSQPPGLIQPLWQHR